MANYENECMWRRTSHEVVEFSVLIRANTGESGKNIESRIRNFLLNLDESLDPLDAIMASLTLTKFEAKLDEVYPTGKESSSIGISRMGFPIEEFSEEEQTSHTLQKESNQEQSDND